MNCSRLRTLLALTGTAMLGAGLVASVPVSAAPPQVPNPQVTGPIASPDIPGAPTHNYSFFASNHPLATAGYVEEEFFFTGTANRYNIPAGATANVVDGGHPYTTRLVVRRPADPKMFNGTVLVEWYNVTNGFDAENVWFYNWEHMLGNGYAWVGVSAQQVGIAALTQFNAERYAGFDATVGGTITRDALSYDIFSQAGQAVSHPRGVDVLGGLKPKVMIAIGESQSASFLSTYVNSIDPLAGTYDGYLLLSSLNNKIRTDVRVPTFKISTEFDVQSGEAGVRQADTSRFHHWEIAGQAHVDQHLRDSREPLELRDRNGVSSEAALAPTCGNPTLGTRVSAPAVIGQAFEELVPWIEHGRLPSPGPEIVTTSLSPITLARNNLGLVLGGIQPSEVSVPIALNVGTNSGPPGSACVRWGFWVPFPVSQLDTMYRNHDDYVNRVAAAALENVKKGFIGTLDAQKNVQDAINTGVGGRNLTKSAQDYLVEFSP